MTLSAPFIARPIGTLLLALGLMLAGGLAYVFLPVAPLPSVDIPFIVVLASRPGADPETMANSIAAPLERHLGLIPGVTELTSLSYVGTTNIVMQFDTSRDIDSAARDVQAAINAAVNDLPTDLPIRPSYRKINPADAPILTLALTSPTRDPGQIYDAADTVLGQRLAQVPGVGQVTINGAEKPAVRVQIDPVRVAAAGIAAEDIYTAILSQNVIGPTGTLQGRQRAETIVLDGQISQADEYAPLVIKSANGVVLRLQDVATIINGVANTRLAAWDGTQPAILITITKDPSANVIETVDAIKAMLPRLIDWMPPDIQVKVIADRTTTIRASLDDVQATLLVTIALVLMVVLVFMRRAASIVAAALTVPLSLAGTLAGMWAFGFSLDNYSLMALVISVGFVVDDAIVMIENITRLREQGLPPLAAALAGARQIGFTVVSITLSFIAIFIPLLFLGGIMGKLLHEFAVTLTLAIVVSALVSLTVTPMVCARFPTIGGSGQAGAPSPGLALWRRVDAGFERMVAGLQRGYMRSLDVTLRTPRLMLLVFVLTVVVGVRLFALVPSGALLPAEDTGLIMGSTIASTDISFAAMEDRQEHVVGVLLTDPAIVSVASTIGNSGGWSPLNRGQLTISLKPLAERGVSAQAVISRLRSKLNRIGGVQTILFPAQDLRTGGRSGGASFQYVVLADTIADMRKWGNALEEALRALPELKDVSSDQDRAGPQLTIDIDRDAAARLGVSVVAIDNALNNAYAQRQISVIYTQRNQYRVVLEAPPALVADPALLGQLYVGTATGTQVPLSSVARFVRASAPVAVHHQGLFPAATLSYNLADGVALGDATTAINAAVRSLRLPPDVHTEAAGDAKIAAQLASNILVLLGAALLTIYIVLGILYESFIQPLTILSTLPSALLGAVLALLATDTPFSINVMIGGLLLMGIVKKNGIMLVDFAVEQQRTSNLSAHAAIRAACAERFRPILMTTLAALLGALPLALATGTGFELRRPLGITVVGGLIASQLLTLYSTPAVYLTFASLPLQMRTFGRFVQRRLTQPFRA